MRIRNKKLIAKIARRVSSQPVLNSTAQIPRFAKISRRVSSQPVPTTTARIPRFGRKKFNNIPCEGKDGTHYDSKLERSVVERQKEIYKTVVPQVSIPLGEGVRMRLDSLTIREFLQDGWFVARFTDAKGRATREWINKSKWCKDKYGIEIQVIKKPSEA